MHNLRKLLNQIKTHPKKYGDKKWIKKYKLGSITLNLLWSISKYIIYWWDNLINKCPYTQSSQFIWFHIMLQTSKTVDHNFVSLFQGKPVIYMCNQVFNNPSLYMYMHHFTMVGQWSWSWLWSLLQKLLVYQKTYFDSKLPPQHPPPPPPPIFFIVFFYYKNASNS